MSEVDRYPGREKHHEYPQGMTHAEWRGLCLVGPDSRISAFDIVRFESSSARIAFSHDQWCEVKIVPIRWAAKLGKQMKKTRKG